MSISNVYRDSKRAEAYATLRFPGTYYLAYRDLPAIIARHVSGRRALDFGCGAGRSTRFLKQQGVDPIGIDVSRSMIEAARRADPEGDYRLVDDGDFSTLEPAGFDLILSAFAFDNIPDAAKRRTLFLGLRGLLKEKGRLILLCSRAEIYTHEWASFTTKDFPENRNAQSGDRVRIIMKDVEDRRPVEDFLWSHQDYLDLFAAAGLNLITHHEPLARPEEPYQWLTETKISPWVIYVLRKK